MIKNSLYNALDHVVSLGSRNPREFAGTEGVGSSGPQVVLPGTWAWYWDADVLTEGDGVDVPSLSPLEGTAVFSAATAGSVSANGFGVGRRSLELDFSNNESYSSTDAGLLAIANVDDGPLSFALHVVPRTVSAQMSWVAFDNATNSFNHLWVGSNATNMRIEKRGNGGGTPGVQNAPNSALAGNEHVLVWSNDGTSCDVYDNSSTAIVSGGALNSSAVTAATAWRIGAYNDGSLGNFPDGFVRRIAIRANTISVSDVVDLLAAWNGS